MTPGPDRRYDLHDLILERDALKAQIFDLVGGPDGLNSYKHRITMYLEMIKIQDIKIGQLKEVLTLIATPPRPDGTYNLSRRACELLARNTLKAVK